MGSGVIVRGHSRRTERHQAIEPEQAQRRHPQPHLPGDVAERVAALVAIGGGIGKLTDANAVEDDEDDSSEGFQGWCDEK
jgi:hypothetical protein